MSTANPSRPTGRSFRLVCPPEQMPQVESLLRAQGYEFEPEPFSPFCRRLLCEPRPLGSSLAAFFGYIYIQDRSSMLPPLALAPRQGAPRSAGPRRNSGYGFQVARQAKCRYSSGAAGRTAPAATAAETPAGRALLCEGGRRTQRTARRF